MSARTGLRSATLPIEHLEAELVAAPLASKVAFRCALTRLDPRLSRDTAELWREVELSLLSRFPGMSVDELVARRDLAWFRGAQSDGRPSTLAHALRSRAREMIEARSGHARPRSTPDGGAAPQRRRWRWTTFSLPADLLVAIAGAGRCNPELVAPDLALALGERGFVEPHLHLKAAVEFETLWSSLLRGIADPEFAETGFESPGAEHDGGRELAPWLLRAALARLFLASFVSLRERPPGGMAHWLRERWPALARSRGALAARALRSSLREVAAGRAEPNPIPFPHLRSLYAELTAANAGPAAKCLDHVHHLDPLARWFPPLRSCSPEYQLLCAGIAHLEALEERGARDVVFERLFWQVVRLRVAFYRHVVQRPMVPGLQWFTRTYARLGPARAAIPLRAFVETACASSGRGLRALEVRVTPDSDPARMLADLRSLDEAAKKLRGSVAADFELGVCYHFSRTRGRDAERGRPHAFEHDTHGDPSGQRNPSGYRYSGYYLEKRAEAAALAGLLETFPRLLERVRAIDLCTDELGIPSWVLAPLLDHVRCASERASRWMRHRHRCAPQPVRRTIHAGEDFVHLLGGLRRVAEVVELLGLCEGDRVGHAVALGVEPAAWSRLVPEVPVPVGERLLDLIWAWRRSMASADGELRTWIPWLHEELRRLSSIAFGESVPPQELVESWEDLHRPRALKIAGFPSGPRPAGDLESSPYSRRLRRLVRWLTDRGVFRRSQLVERVETEREVPLLRALQRSLRAKLGTLGIPVEINPSSNLLIGNLGSLCDHPMWRLRPPRPAPEDPPPVRVCIGSDDPITFATSLPQEYQLLMDAMVEAGLSSDEALEWLEEVRAAGTSSRFTVPRSEEPLDRPMRLEAPSAIL